MVTEAVKKQKTKPKKVNNLRHAEYYSMQETFDELFARAGKKENFGRLMDLILRRDNILLAYRNMKGNTGSVTPGTDKLTIHDVEKFTPDGLVAKVRNIIKIIDLELFAARKSQNPMTQLKQGRWVSRAFGTG